jgi:ABC-2 type transport system permease protein
VSDAVVQAPAGVERPASSRPEAIERPAPPRFGWLVVANKEFSDHLLSARFVVLLIVLAVASLIPLYFASGQILDAAADASGASSVFLAQFTLAPEGVQFLRVDYFVAILAPLLGIAFGFDAVNSERSEGTLPRLLSQPIHRDDVINGKFAGGVAVIGLAMIGLASIITGFGLLRLGIAPGPAELLRIVAWLVITTIYVGFWLAFGTLLSVLLRRAATSALIGFGIWVAVTFFGQLIVSFVAGVLASPADNSNAERLRSEQVSLLIQRILPDTLYREATSAILSPFDAVTNATIGAGSFTPATLDQLIQAQDPRRLPSVLPLDQSLLLVWPHVVILVALTIVMFAGAYVAFMRQEVRA